MDPLLTHLPLVMKETSQICANMHGMNGVTSEIKQQHFPTTRKFWEEYLAQPEEQAMKWPNVLKPKSDKVRQTDCRAEI